MNNATPVYLPRRLVNQIMQHAQTAPDAEVCGLMAARAQRPCRLYPMHNVSPTPATRFQMDEREQLDTAAIMRERGEMPYAIYHSHPTAPALPSRHDLEEHGHPELLHLIITLNTRGVLELRAFSLDQDPPVEHPLLLDDSPL